MISTNCLRVEYFAVYRHPQEDPFCDFGKDTNMIVCLEGVRALKERDWTDCLYIALGPETELLIFFLSR